MKNLDPGRRRLSRPQDRRETGEGPARSAAAPVTGLTLFDLAEPPPPDAPFPVTSVAGDIVALPDAAIPPGTDVVFHLAAVVSAQAEADYELGRRVNLRGTDAVVDRCRALVATGGKPPRVVFTSSVASFSGGQSANLADDARQIAGNTYGAQKAAAELILADASAAASWTPSRCGCPPSSSGPAGPTRRRVRSFPRSFASRCSAWRPNCRCADDFAAWVCSPRRAVDWLLHAAALDTSTTGPRPRHQSAGHQRDRRPTAACAGSRSRRAPRRLSGVSRTRPSRRSIGTWPPAFEALRARTLGFSRRTSRWSI